MGEKNSLTGFCHNDDRVLVTSYGTKIDYDSKDKDAILIKVPSEQIVAEVDLIIGTGLPQKKVKFVEGNDLEKVVGELEDDGYEILKVSSESLKQEIKINMYNNKVLFDTQIGEINNKIIVGGPAINRAAAQILNVEFPMYPPQIELDEDEAVIRYYDEHNSVLIYGYDANDTRIAVEKFLDYDFNGGVETYLDTNLG